MRLRFEEMDNRLLELAEGLDDPCGMQAALNEALGKLASENEILKIAHAEEVSTLREKPCAQRRGGKSEWEVRDEGRTCAVEEDGLQPWVKLEIEGEEPKILPLAIAIAESLVEFKKADKVKNRDSKEEAQKMGLAFSGQVSWLKAVNSKPIPTHGVATNVGVKIVNGLVMLIFVVSMDDYSCVLGMNFMDRVKAIPIPFAIALYS
ncbi:hypothetical protein GH714_023015 [Hevea brasiliensis]|uniref:Uncharacterized protein n=1 Tax=Hevea brasiliensis TaxID=3981 RepID=A0A6A6M9J2_HEVBR|nr:hypothetical protein GH714_023015 [Hevea brasiliensis]